MLLVSGHIKSNDISNHFKYKIPLINYEKGIDFEVEINEPSLDENAMPIKESNIIIIDAINKKYETDFSYKDILTPVKIKQVYSVFQIENMIKIVNDKDFEYQILEAMKAYKANLYLACASTLGVAMETLCKILLIKKGNVRSDAIKNTQLGDLSLQLKKKGIISNKDKERIMLGAKFRNLSSHTNPGPTEKLDCDVLISTVEFLVNAHFAK